LQISDFKFIDSRLISLYKSSAKSL